ncbi:hypothetical protein [Halalkalibacter oceani]|uniref:hypothetical protein n=1 Tax=Halalkalibacter oceani TaxID=1653776 RepID=UPI003399C75B
MRRYDLNGGVRTFRAEGGSHNNLVPLIREIGRNTDVEVRFGTVTSRPPDLRIKEDGVDRILDPDDCAVAERVTGSNELRPGDRVILLAYATSIGTQYVVIDRLVTYGGA